MSNASRQPHGIDRLDAIPFLVVEDDPASARLVAIVLASEGATDVRVAHSAEDALAILRDDFIRVLIVDLLLPGMDGLVFVRKVKSEQATRHIIAIAISGWDEARLASDAIDSGCIAFVPKPIEFDRLVAIVRASLVQPAGEDEAASSTGRDS